MPDQLNHEPNEPSRRNVLKDFAAAAALTLASEPLAAETSSSAGPLPATKPAASKPTIDITITDIASADRIAGRDYFSDAERELMREGLASKRDVLKALRARHIPETTAPSVHFAALAPSNPPPGPSACKISDAPLPDYSGHIEDLAFASAVDLSRLIHARKISSQDVTKMYLARLKTIGQPLNCVITLTEDLALEQARRADAELAQGKSRGPLHGIPYGLKDFAATRNYPTTWGVELYKDRIFDYDATVVTKLEQAGAVLCAKLSLGELCMGDVWYNGRTNCPWDIKEGSSGSSAGPCAATAAGLVAFAIGSETLGSIVSPCMVNGTTGLRPTYGRVSRHGAMSLSLTMDKLGPITRTVEDAALVFAAIQGPDPNDTTAADYSFLWDPSTDVSKLRVGYDAEAFKWDAETYRKDPELKTLHQTAFDAIESLAGKLVPIHLPPAADYKGLASLTIACEAACNFTELLTSGDVRKLKQQDEGSWPHTFRVGSTIPASDYLRGMKARTQLQHAMAEAMRDVDLYLTLPYAGPTIQFTNLTGHPSLVTRCGMHKGRPKLLEFIGHPFREDAILRLAFEYEKTHDWTQYHPA